MDKDWDAKDWYLNRTVFKPHSTRLASTSKARSCNVQLPAVMKAASWSGDCVFSTVYNNLVQPQNLSDSFSHAILLLLWKHTGY